MNRATSPQRGELRQHLHLPLRWLFAMSLAACGGIKPQPLPDKCVKLAEQCKLPDGPVGVCNAVDCKPGETAPCLVCMSQH